MDSGFSRCPFYKYPLIWKIVKPFHPSWLFSASTLYFSWHFQLGVFLRIIILFNIGVRESTAISGKIFDYMGYCKPIITTSFIDNEGTIPYIMNYPQGLVIDERLPIEINIEKLRNFLIGCSKSTFSFEEVAQKFSSALPSSYVKSIEEL